MGHAGETKPVLEVYARLNVAEGVLSLIRQDSDAQAIDVALKCLFELLRVGAHEGGDNIILKYIESVPGCL
jgi:hypothetical protein